MLIENEMYNVKVVVHSCIFVILSFHVMSH